MHVMSPSLRSPRRWPLATAASLLVSALLAACGGDGNGPPPTPVAASLQVMAGNAQSGTVGEALADSLVVRALDADGDEVEGVTVTWAVESGGGTVTASSRTDAAGTARARWTMGNTAGAGSVRATSGSGNTTFSATAEPGPAATIQIQPNVFSIEAGQTRQYSATARDAFNNDVTGRPVSWTTSGNTVATVNATGLLTALSPGSVQLRATIDGQVGFATITVTGNPALQPTVTGITPELLTPGITATMTGTNFNTNPGATTVSVNGAAANVTVQSATQLQFVVPSAATIGCAPAGAVNVGVTVSGLSAQRSHPVRTGTIRTLAVGDTLHSAANAPLGCTELPGGNARYLVAITNTGNYLPGSGGLLGGQRGLGVQMRARTGFSGNEITTPEATSSAARAPSYRQLPLSPRAARSLEHLRAHTTFMERNWQALSALPAPSRRAAASVLAQTAAPGDTMWVRYPNPLSSSCSNYDSLRARVVHVGQRAIMLEDVAAPLKNQVDSMYVKLANEFDTLQYNIVRDNFDDPLVYDAQTNGDGKLFMLFTRRVNNAGGLAGFVWPGDLLPRSSCTQSNVAEIFYGIVPTVLSGTTSGSEYTPSEWFLFSRATVIHEVKHIASVASRLSRNSPFFGDSIWSEEGTAQIAEEMWARRVFGYQQNGNTNYLQSVRSELANPNSPFVMINHFAFLYDYYAAPETHSILGKAAADDGTIYGSAWAFLRWLADQSGRPEGEVFRQLTRANTAGVASVEAVVGRPFAQLLREFALASALDDRPGLTGIASRYSHPSWNTRDIYAGLNADLSQFFPAAFPLNVRTVGSDAISINEIRAGGSAFFEIQLSGTARAFQVLDQFGAELAATTPLRVTVIRIE